MAAVTKSSSASFDTVTQINTGAKIPVLPDNPHVAGEAITICSPCYLKASDGKIYLANGTANDEEAEVLGWAANAASAGEQVTLWQGEQIIYYSDDFSGASISPGDILYLGTTNGALSTTATLGDNVGIARVLDDNHIQTFAPRTVPGSGAVQVAKAALGTADTAAGILSWANPHSQAIWVFRLVIDRTTASSGAGTGNFGTAATAISNDTLIDGLDLNAAAAAVDNHTTPGTNGLAGRRVPSGEFVTGTTATGSAAGMAGSAYIHYIIL